MGEPKRIQRQRTKGWRMPPETRYVGRPSAWGNPFSIGSLKWFVNDDDPTDRVVIGTADAEEAVENFRWLMRQDRLRALVRKELAGLSLACWCPLDQPCHADVLLEIANQEARR